MNLPNDDLHAAFGGMARRVRIADAKDELYRLALDLIAARDRCCPKGVPKEEWWRAEAINFADVCRDLADRAEAIRDRIEGGAADAR